MEIKEQIEKLLKAVTENASLKELFENEPVKAVEKIVGKDLPDELVEKIIDGVKAKLTVDQVKDIAGALKKLF